jgi:AcrR family transcriptional regulator
VSGPAVYRHFPGKQAVLAALLIDVSRDLVAGGHAVIAKAPDYPDALRGLIAFHVEFALSNADVIVVQDRDLDSLADEDRSTVRTLQRSYIESWVNVLSVIHSGVPVAELRIRVRATFGLINSTPHSARTSPRASVRKLLESMALAALTSD